MNRLEPSKKTLILRKMYELTENTEYLNKMIDVDRQDMETYTSLLIMHDDKKLDTRPQDCPGGKLKKIVRNDEKHKKSLRVY